jgi:hypothetical protein
MLGHTHRYIFIGSSLYLIVFLENKTEIRRFNDKLASLIVLQFYENILVVQLKIMFNCRRY